LVRFPIDYNDWKEVGRTGEKITAIGLGTWAIRDYGKAFDVYVYGLKNGLNHVDTAEMYDNGLAEEFISRVVREVGRDSIFITTKMMPQHLVSRNKVLRAARNALNRLGVSYVDLFLIHWPNPNLSISIQVKNFEAVFEAGYTRFIGVSNFDRWELEEALNSTSKAEVVVNQVHYSVLNKSIERDLLPYAIREGVTIQAYTPLEKGSVARHPIIRDIARKYDKTPVQIALNYLISRPRVVAIPKTENIDHLKEIISSMNWRLREEDIEVLEKI